jgi:hypothetical protein
MVSSKIILLIFETQFDITSTLLRFQEYYEGPFFRGKVFTLKEYKKWYIQSSPEGRETGKFTYYTDWNGFNIPSYIFEPFKAGWFNPLSVKEKKILKILEKQNLEEPFYLIAVTKQSKNVGNVLNHELKHALFYTNETYRKGVVNLVSEYDFSKLEEELGRMGYTKEVFLDEINAFITSDSYPLETVVPKGVKNKLIKLYAKYGGELCNH